MQILSPFLINVFFPSLPALYPHISALLIQWISLLDVCMALPLSLVVLEACMVLPLLLVVLKVCMTLLMSLEVVEDCMALPLSLGVLSTVLDLATNMLL